MMRVDKRQAKCIARQRQTASIKAGTSRMGVYLVRAAG